MHSHNSALTQSSRHLNSINRLGGNWVRNKMDHLAFTLLTNPQWINSGRPESTPVSSNQVSSAAVATNGATSPNGFRMSWFLLEILGYNWLLNSYVKTGWMSPFALRRWPSSTSWVPCLDRNDWAVHEKLKRHLQIKQDRKDEQGNTLPPSKKKIKKKIAQPYTLLHSDSWNGCWGSTEKTAGWRISVQFWNQSQSCSATQLYWWRLFASSFFVVSILKSIFLYQKKYIYRWSV